MSDLPAAGDLEQLEERFSLALSAHERGGLESFVQLLRQWGKRFNLAGPALLRDPYPHLLEGIWARRRGLLPARRWLDVGSGAGIPALSIALSDPRIQITLIERSQKKAVFLKEAIRRLRLEAKVHAGDYRDFTAWGEAEAVSLRALKVEDCLLERLRRFRLSLSWFRAGEEQVRLEGLRLSKQLRVPGSERRWVSLLAPVSRET